MSAVAGGGVAQPSFRRCSAFLQKMQRDGDAAFSGGRAMDQKLQNEFLLLAFVHLKHPRVPPIRGTSSSPFRLHFRAKTLRRCASGATNQKLRNEIPS